MNDASVDSQCAAPFSSQGRRRPGAKVRAPRRSYSAFSLEPLESRQLLTTYYVATNGNDDNPGTAASPFQHLQNAVSNLVAGDTLNIRAGTYDEGILIGWDDEGFFGPRNGTANAPIVIQADPTAATGSVIINGQSNKTLHAIDVEPGSSWIVFRGITVINPGNDQLNGDGIHVAGSDNVSVLNCTVTGMLRFGIFCSSATNFLVQGCNASNNPGNGSPTTGHGIYISNSSVNPIVRGNLIANNGSQGLHLNGDVTSGGTGMVTGALIENNVIANNINNGINADGLAGSIIRNNLIYGSTKHGISLYHIDASSGSSGNMIVNNTIYSPNSSGAAVQIVSQSVGNILFNNVLIGGEYGAVSISNDSSAGFASDYNAVGNLFRSDDSEMNFTLAQWRMASAQDVHSVNINPSQNFANLAANDFYPRSGAAIVNAGNATFGTIPAPLADILGHARPADVRPDIGAYEFGSNSGPNASPVGYIDIAGPKIVRGWTADFDSPATSLTVRLDVDGSTYSTTTANGARGDLIPVIGSSNHGFSFDLSALPPGIHRVDLYALDAETGQAVFIARRQVSTNSPPTGWLDLLSASVISGWAADPNAGSSAVQIRYVIDSNAPVVITANRTRADLVGLLGSADHGFMAALPQLTAGAHGISVYAIDTTTLESTLIASRTFAVTNPAGNLLPTGYVEVATATRVSGWAMDMTAKGTSINVRIDVDGVAGAPFAANLARKDVATAMKVTGNFGFSKSLSLTPGQHRVEVYALDSTTGLPVLLSRRFVSSATVQASIDVLTSTHVVGWAFSAAGAGTSATIRIDVDGLAGTPVLANVSRPDLASLLGASNFGFNAMLPPLSPGIHTITLNILDPLTMVMTKLFTAAVAG